MTRESSTVVRGCMVSTWEANNGTLIAYGEPGLHTEFQHRLGYTSSLKAKTDQLYLR